MLTRRDFVKTSGSLACLGAIALIDACGSKNDVAPKVPVSFTIDLSDPSNAALQNVGGAVLKSGVIIIRRSSSSYIALSTTCTHAGCTVNYSGSSGKLVCPCHGSIFNNQGQVLQGPASSPLPTYTVTVMGSNLSVAS